MAQTQQDQAPAPRGGEELIDEFERIANILIASAGAYVSSGVEDEAASANIRRVRVIAGSLQGALNAITMMPRIPEPPRPPPPPEPGEPQGGPPAGHLPPPTTAPLEVEPATAAPARSR